MDNDLFESDLEPQQLFNNLDSFVIKAKQLAKELGINIAELDADHIAIRMNQANLVQQAHKAWLKYGSEISSAQINGRPIIVILFNQPLRVGSWCVECLELPYPARGKTYPQQGWEHMEFVISSDAQTAEGYLDDLKRQFPQLAQNWHRLNDANIEVKLSCPKGEHERLANPTIAFKRGGICIKFHPHSLKTVVASEK